MVARLKRRHTSARKAIDSSVGKKNNPRSFQKQKGLFFGSLMFVAVVVLLVPVLTLSSNNNSYDIYEMRDWQAIIHNSKNNSKKNYQNYWDSSKSAVLGLASGYELATYQQFVGSLRATGFPGPIILGIAPNIPSDALEYLKEQNVITKVVETAVNCTYDNQLDDGRPIRRIKGKCPKDYPNYKFTWGRFALYKDWLLDCRECTDGVVLTDVRDAYFQRDPFQTAIETQAPLMLFEEWEHQTTAHWITDKPVKKCRNGHVLGARPMLCSGSTMGSREGILDYIDIMKEEFDYWFQTGCINDMKGDDQSIHNYLYYTNRFKNTTVSIPHRTGPLHVVGAEATFIRKTLEDRAKDKQVSLEQLYENSSKWQQWLPDDTGYIDKETGLVLNKDGTPSAQLHQIDRYRSLLTNWLQQMKEHDWPYNKQ